METFSLGGGKEGSSTRSRVRIDFNGGGYVSFFNDLDKDNELCSWPRVQSPNLFSFFNKLATERKTMLIASISFFNEISTKKKTILKNFVSFFNDLSTKNKNYAQNLYFIF
jgi:hypothetical protein